MAGRVFDHIARVDARPSHHGEGLFKFLNRSASAYFGHVRELIDEWFSHVPAEHQGSLRGALRADDHHTAAAFWELYLHEAYRRSGFEIEIHPEIPGRPTRPDFRLTLGNERFYLEAVTVGRAPDEVAEDHRLDQVHRVLTNMRTTDFGLALETYDIGPRPLTTRPLRGQLQRWLEQLDPDHVTAAVAEIPNARLDHLPTFTWEDDGWRLTFRALPRGPHARGTPQAALGVMGPGEATTVDNAPGIRRVLDSKRGKYGTLDAPLVVAVQSNTEYTTQDYEVENALFGVSPYRPARRAWDSSHMVEEGFWIEKTGWRNHEVPQVITIYSLAPWRVTQAQPRCWNSLEPEVTLPNQPDWLAPMIIGNEPLPGKAISLAAHFGLADDWPGLAGPDFDPR